ncbi:MAG: hypothetical protein ACO1SX_14160 [Actinomycetota bacterium]
MGDITSHKLIIAKGFLFLLAGFLAAAALLLEHPTLKVAFLLCLAVWCFARFYYFAFYVIEHYVDSSHKFAGLGPFALYMLRRWRGGRAASSETEPQMNADGHR